MANSGRNLVRLRPEVRSEWFTPQAWQENPLSMSDEPESPSEVRARRLGLLAERGDTDMLPNEFLPMEEQLREESEEALPGNHSVGYRYQDFARRRPSLRRPEVDLEEYPTMEDVQRMGLDNVGQGAERGAVKLPEFREKLPVADPQVLTAARQVARTAAPGRLESLPGKRLRLPPGRQPAGNPLGFSGPRSSEPLPPGMCPLRRFPGNFPGNISAVLDPLLAPTIPPLPPGMLARGK
jgi:hypothetical protein